MARALILRKSQGGVESEVREIALHDIPSPPDRDTLIEVLFSSLNYKDGLAVTGRGKIVRAPYPFVPGIDLAGRILESTSDRFHEGDLVIGTGWGIGETHWGGFIGIQRVNSSWLVPLPGHLDPQQAMVIGTAGLTAMLSVMALEDHGAVPGGGEILVTGASGGVGSIAVALLRRAGFDVAASTGSTDTEGYLKDLGAGRLLSREEFASGPARPLDSAEWTGAIDVVGGPTLAKIISRLDRHACVASCGLAGGHELHTTVYPFILRGVNLLGIDSNTCANDVRIHAWSRIAGLLQANDLQRIHAGTISLDDVPEYSKRILDGDIQGRMVIDLMA